MSIHNGHIPRAAIQRHCIRKLLDTLVGGDSRLDIDLAFFVGAGYHPQTTSRRGIEKLYLKVEAVNAGIPAASSAP